MKKAIIAALVAGLAIGTVAGVHAKLPAAPAKSEAEKAAVAEKAAAAKAKEADLLNKAQEKAVASYRKNKGIADPAPAQKASAATTSGKK